VYSWLVVVAGLPQGFEWVGRYVGSSVWIFERRSRLDALGLIFMIKEAKTLSVQGSSL
jgi:TRAP-type mannitol/chloroaromatic compound transport system permease small subunit